MSKLVYLENKIQYRRTNRRKEKFNLVEAPDLPETADFFASL